MCWDDSVWWVVFEGRDGCQRMSDVLRKYAYRVCIYIYIYLYFIIRRSALPPIIMVHLLWPKLLKEEQSHRFYCIRVKHAKQMGIQSLAMIFPTTLTWFLFTFPFKIYHSSVLSPQTNLWFPDFSGHFGVWKSTPAIRTSQVKSRRSIPLEGGWSRNTDLWNGRWMNLQWSSTTVVNCNELYLCSKYWLENSWTWTDWGSAPSGDGWNEGDLPYKST